MEGGEEDGVCCPPVIRSHFQDQLGNQMNSCDRRPTCVLRHGYIPSLSRLSPFSEQSPLATAPDPPQYPHTDSPATHACTRESHFLPLDHDVRDSAYAGTPPSLSPPHPPRLDPLFGPCSGSPAPDTRWSWARVLPGCGKGDLSRVSDDWPQRR